MRVDPVFRRRVLAALDAYRWAGAACVLLLAAGLAIWVWGVRPRAERATLLQREFLESRRRLADVDEADSAVRRYLSAKETLQAYRRELPDEGKLRDLAAEIDGFVAAHRISAEPVRFRSDRMGELMLLRYVADMELRAPYARLKGFLADLGNSPSLFCVERFALANRGGDAELAELRLTAATYVRARPRLQPLAQ